MNTGMSEPTSRKYLFVCGVPRSGTSAITSLLNEHPKIALGLERYRRVPRAALNENLFSKAQFFDFQPSDLTKGLYARLEEKYDDAAWLGDKVPRYYTKYRQLFDRFENSIVIYMLRDIHAVSSSWNRRADNPDDIRWSESNDYVSAVAEWNFSLQQTAKFKEQYPDRLLIVQFERFYCGNVAALETILHKLALSAPRRMLQRFQAMTRDWDARSKKPLCEREGQFGYIESHADRHTYSELMKLAVTA